MPKPNLSSRIGNLIKELREAKQLTQQELADRLKTSQSAVARIERGEQNLSAEMLNKVSRALNHKLVTVAPKSIDFEIQGGKPLSGEIVTNTSKNGAMGLMCAALLNQGKTILHGIPRIEEVNRITEVLTSIGVNLRWIGKKSLEINPPKQFDLSAINSASAGKTRSIIMFLGPLAHALESFSLPHSKGCTLGKRSIAAHMYALEKLGIKIKVTPNSYQINSKQMRPNREIIMYEAGDTACENVIMTAAKIPGKTTIKFASSNYMVQDVCCFLQKLGIKIEGIGSSTLTIHGVEKINQTVEHYNSEDPIESMTWISAAVITKSNLTIKACPIDFLELELLKLEKMGLKYKRSRRYLSRNQHTELVDLEILAESSKLKALPEKIDCRPYPGLNIDNLPFFVPIATQAQGTTLIHDWVYEDRAIYFMELSRLDAKMILADPHRVYIEGSTQLKPAQVVCPPALRPATMILLAMLAAPGRSILRNVYSISRGYEEIAERLNQLGAEIKILTSM